jgi:hypothetical protein
MDNNFAVAFTLSSLFPLKSLLIIPTPDVLIHLAFIFLENSFSTAQIKWQDREIVSQQSFVISMSSLALKPVRDSNL